MAFGIALGSIFGIAGTIAFQIGRGIGFGILVGILTGIFGGINGEIAFEISSEIGFGIRSELAFAIAFAIAGSIAFKMSDEFAFAITFGFGRGSAGGIVFGIVFGIARGIAGGIVLGITIGIASTVTFLRLYYHPLVWWMCWPKPIGRLYPYHPVAWDDLCLVPFPALDRLLISYREYNRDVADREIERLIRDYPSQRNAALRAKTTILCREAAQVSRLTEVERIIANLPQGDRGFLAQTAQVKQWVFELTALQTRLDTINRPALREPFVELLTTKIENFKSRVAGLREPLSSELIRAAEHWLELAKSQKKEVEAILKKEPMRQYFRAGDPVNREQEAFVPRERVIGDLQQQVLLSTGCPGLLIYGRRRVGKSTLIKNLEGLLPESIRVVQISMQSAEAFTSIEYFVAKLCAEMRATIGEDLQVPEVKSDLLKLSRFLEALNLRLNEREERLLLSIDEYENIDKKIGEGTLSSDLLAMIRESIQNHRRIVWAFAGSHHISELRHAEWTSYLISARTIEIPMFSPEETRFLLSDPMHYSSLWAGREKERPRYDPLLWGERGIERIHAQAGGWPVLVQLIAETAIDLINESNARHLDPELFEETLNRAVERGDTVFFELLQRESTLAGEWEYLQGFCDHATQAAPTDPAIRSSLRRRLLVTAENEHWRLRVPLMERWLKRNH